MTPEEFEKGKEKIAEDIFGLIRFKKQELKNLNNCYDVYSYLDCWYDGADISDKIELVGYENTRHPVMNRIFFTRAAANEYLKKFGYNRQLPPPNAFSV